MQVERRLRIGELARRTGTSPELLRAWEQRYGLLDPVRSASGYRLYSAADEQRIRAMRARLAEGMSAAQAALAVRVAPAPADALERLSAAFDRFDAAAAEDLLDQLFAARSSEDVIVEVVLPVLSVIGERWRRGEQEIAREHFASNLIGGRLRGLARGWDVEPARGPCWRARRASATTSAWSPSASPCASAAGASRCSATTAPQRSSSAPPSRSPHLAVVLAAVVPEPFADPALAALGRGRLLAIGGPGAGPDEAGPLGAVLLEGDPYTAAAQVSVVAR